MAGTSYLWLLIYAALIWFLGAFVSLLISRWSAKRAYGIVPVQETDISQLSAKQRLVYDTVVDIATKHNIKIPEVGFYNAHDPNAFATGATKNSSLVAVSSGLLDMMNEKEIEAVVAHEMAHILNGDMVTMTLLTGVMNTFVIFFARIAATFIEWFLFQNEKEEENNSPSMIYYIIYIVLEIIFWILASIVVMAFSRHREFKADEWSARFVGKEKMIAALRALDHMKELAPNDSSKMATMQINTQTRHGMKKLFMSHPPLEERISYLENLMM